MSSTVIRTIVIDLMRHGEKSNDFNTAFGLDQVAASVRMHLRSIELDAAYHGDTNRAREAVTHALMVLGQTGVIMEPHEAFSVAAFLEGDGLSDLIATLAAIGKGGTMQELIQGWRLGEAACKQVRSGLFSIAGELAMIDPDKRERHVLVGFNDPFIGAAAVDPDDMPARFNFADIVRYTLTDEGGGWAIVSSALLRCPLVKIGS